jgi:hypothetical protein
MWAPGRSPQRIVADAFSAVELDFPYFGGKPQGGRHRGTDGLDVVPVGAVERQLVNDFVGIRFRAIGRRQPREPVLTLPLATVTTEPDHDERISGQAHHLPLHGQEETQITCRVFDTEEDGRLGEMEAAVEEYGLSNLKAAARHLRKTT